MPGAGTRAGARACGGPASATPPQTVDRTRVWRDTRVDLHVTLYRRERESGLARIRDERISLSRSPGLSV